MKTTTAIASLFASLSVVSAHTIFQELYVDGVSQGRFNGIRYPEYNGPITDVTSNDIICNGGINPLKEPLSTTVIKVPGGSQVTAQWHYTTSSESGDNSDPIDPSHNGPILAYLAKVPSALQKEVTGLKWFKIYHDGLDSNGWAVERLVNNQGKVSFTIPDCIESGEYLLRVELIALHGAQTYPGAQFYMECAQLEITGTSGAGSPATVSFPGAYSGSDPGVAFNLYNGATSYPIPGPSVFACGSSEGSNPSPIPSTTAVTTRAPITTSAVPTTSAVTGNVPRFGQCGGSGYIGPTGCFSPYTCVESNEWYSQCL